MNISDMLRHEFIGLNISVVEARNKKLIGIKGKITNETKNMLEINNSIKLIKDQIIFNIKKNNYSFIINGKQIMGRPEDRIKKIRKI